MLRSTSIGSCVLLLAPFAPLALRASSAPSAIESHLRAQETAAPAAASLSRASRGAPTCGLGKEFHAGRRAELRQRLKQGLVLVRGLIDPRENAAFHQDKVYWYLTGIESPDAALLMDCESGQEILYLPKSDPFRESWNGEVWDSKDEWVKTLTGFTEVHENGALIKDLTAMAAGRAVWISKSPWVALAGSCDQAGSYDKQLLSDPLDGRPSREKALAQKLETDLHLEVKDLSPVLDEMRRIKQPAEIDAMRRASRAGALAMAEAMRSTRAGLSEADLAGLMSFIHLHEGADGPAYEAIVGSGKNSCTLHYCGLNGVMQAGDALLIDYAPEVDHYTSDITRTWVVGASPSPRFVELYEAVLAAQKAGIAAVKPGATLRDVQEACDKVISERKLKTLVRHGPSHYIGLEVHDVGKFGKPLEPGVAFTIEPGLYDAEAGIGVRIEDVVIVTQDGCEVVSAGVPKELAEIEKLIQSEGVLDRMAAPASR